MRLTKLNSEAATRKKELENRLRALNDQIALSKKAYDDTKEELNKLQIKENEILNLGILQQYQKFKGEIIVIQSYNTSYVLKCKDVKYAENLYSYRCLTFIPETEVFYVNTLHNNETVKKLQKITIDVGDDSKSITAVKDWNVWDKRSVCKILDAATGLTNLLKEAGIVVSDVLNEIKE